MRKTYMAFAVALALLGPSVLAQPNKTSAPDESPTTSSLRIESEEGDSCRQECADDGTDPDECQMDCNATT